MKQTPCQQRGWKIGDQFTVTSDDSIFTLNSIIELDEDAGTPTPRFKLLKGICVGGTPSSNGYTYDYTSVTYITKLAPIGEDTTRHFNNVLQEAESIIYGDREETYGEPDKNLRHIAEQWTLYLSQKYGFTVENSLAITPEDVCYMMADLKKCRQMNCPKRDNVVDGIGYLALTERLKK